MYYSFPSLESYTVQEVLISFVYHHPSYKECKEERRSIDVNLTSQLESFICPFPILVLDSRFWISSFSICPINFPSSFIFAASRLAVLINLFFGHNVILYSFINIVVVICFRSKTQINCYLYVWLFLCLKQVLGNCSEFWLVQFSMSTRHKNCVVSERLWLL